MSDSRRRLESLYAECAPSLLGCLLGMVGERAWAEDLLQEAFLRVASRVVQVRDDAALRAYLFRTATHLAIDGLRRRKTAARALDGAVRSAVERAVDVADVDPAGALEAGDLAAAVRRALDDVAPPVRAAVILRVVVGLSFEDVGAALGVSDRSASRLVQEGIARVRRRLSRGADPSDRAPSETTPGPRGTHEPLRS
jgi:RNA polymerase sigma-70 factor, ECF subfamily